MLLSPSCFGPVSQSPLSLHCFSHLLSPSCFGPVRQYPQYLLDCQCHSLLLISCPFPAVKLFCLFHHICCRPYHVECTGSLPTSEVKRHRARLVLGWGTAWEDLRVLTAFYLSTFKPGGNECCHVNVVILDSGNTPAQHAQCHTTPAARFLEISNISGLFALLFFAIRICGLGLWPDSTTACPMSYYTCCTSSSFHFLSGVMPCGQGIPYIQSQCCIAALRRHISKKISEIRNLAVGHTMSNAPDLF